MRDNEIRWANEEDFMSEKHREINTRGNEGQAGVMFVMRKRLCEKLEYQKQYNDGNILIRIRTNRKSTLTFKVYTPDVSTQVTK